MIGGRKTRSKRMSGVRRKNKSKRMSGVRRKNKSKRMSGVRRNNKSRKIYGGMMRSVISKAGASTAGKSSGKGHGSQKSSGKNKGSGATYASSMRSSSILDRGIGKQQNEEKEKEREQVWASRALESTMKEMQPQYHNAWAVWMANIAEAVETDDRLEPLEYSDDNDEETELISKKNKLEEQRKIYYPRLQQLYNAAAAIVDPPPPHTSFLTLNQILERWGTKSEYIVV